MLALAHEFFALDFSDYNSVKSVIESKNWFEIRTKLKSFVNIKPQEDPVMNSSKSSKIFVVAHGAWAGAWGWEDVARIFAQ